MKKFLNDNFMLENETAVKLYNGYVKEQPIFDFHCHLNPKEIYEDKKFRSIAEAWLGGDHYKWRLMREAGVPEEYISGNKSDKEKFFKYAEVIPYAIGNPVYVWTHLELKRYFNIDTVLSPATAEEIWEKANKKLENLTARKMIEMNNVTALYTTDDPADDLKYHKLLKEDKTFKVKVMPAFRPDKAINIERPMFYDWLAQMEKTAGRKLDTLQKLTDALKERIKYFDALGACCSDHALDVVMFAPATIEEANDVYVKTLKHLPLTQAEIAKYKGYVLTELGKEYNKHNWVQQYHIGALRNASSRYMRVLGADTGFDAIEDQPFASALASLLDSLDSTGELPKTVLYCLNPRDNEVLATIKNCFQQSGTAAKIQFGSAWWFNDQKDGINRQLEALSQVGLISKFIGMLTDSRSFLSYPRHEFFRRIVCNRLGALIESGEYPDDLEIAGNIAADISYRNALKYFSK